MVKRVFPGLSCSFRLPAFLGWCRFPLLEGLGFLGFVWYLGLYCYLLGRIFLPLDVYIFVLIQCNSLFVFYYVSLDVFASGVWATFAGLRDPSWRELASRL